MIASWAFFLLALLLSSKRESRGGWPGAVLKSGRAPFTKLMAYALATWGAALILAMSHQSKILDWFFAL